jgi:uncharacterized protein YecE (DUF72 family)
MKEVLKKINIFEMDTKTDSFLTESPELLMNCKLDKEGSPIPRNGKSRLNQTEEEFSCNWSVEHNGTIYASFGAEIKKLNTVTNDFEYFCQSPAYITKNQSSRDIKFTTVNHIICQIEGTPRKIEIIKK